MRSGWRADSEASSPLRSNLSLEKRTSFLFFLALSFLFYLTPLRPFMFPFHSHTLTTAPLFKVSLLEVEEAVCGASRDTWPPSMTYGLFVCSPLGMQKVRCFFLSWFCTYTSYRNVSTRLHLLNGFHVYINRQRHYDVLFQEAMAPACW